MNQNSDIDSTLGKGPVLVTGATGDVGGRVLRLLARDGIPVRALHRRAEQQERLAIPGVTPVRGDFGDRDALAKALSGCAKLFLITPPVPGQLQMDRTAIDLAREHGITHVVRLSAGDSNVRTAVPWARAHAHADHHLAASGLGWTVLRASAFMQNFAQQANTIRRGLLPQTSGRGEVSWVDTADVAAVAHHVLTHDGHLGATYFLTGPESLSVPQVAERFAAVLHGPVRYVHLPSPLYALALRLAGRSWFVANGLRHQFADVIRGNADIDTTHEVHRLLGRPPRSITAWITDNIDQFTQSNRRSAIPALTRFRRIR